MRLSIGFVVTAALVGGTAEAQNRMAPTSRQPDSVYIEAVAQSTVANVTSQSYGVEAGVKLWKHLRVFVEGGKTRNVATSDLGPSAGQLASYLSGAQSGSVSFSVKEPVTFGAAGLRYAFAGSSARASPYVIAGAGLAKVTKDVRFAVAGTDVTSGLAQFGVVLGSDLSGSYTKPMVVVGGGIAWTAWQRLMIDFQYRYARISPENQIPLQPAIPGININRIGAGIGLRF